MQIMGIRSFHPMQESNIKFESPITIIAGQNGAGKTSIIECLRYMTTGTYPPNSAGGAFVTDPKLLGRSEVKGKIMLKFRNHLGEKQCATRLLQSTLRPNGGITTKALDSNLRKEDDTKASISSRCTDMDREMVRQLGVSKHVLSSVIFCHQEESHWPLAESKELKTRFDSIFEIIRFTKALENMKKLKSDYLQESKMIENDLKHIGDKKDQVDEYKFELSSLEKAMSIKQTEFSELEAFIGEKERELARSSELLAAAHKRDSDHKTKINNRKHVEQNISSFEGKFMHIDPTGDVEALKRKKEEHADRMKEEERRQRSRDRELKEVEKDRSEAEEQLKQQEQQLYKLDENRKSLENRKIILKEMMDELAAIMSSSSSPLLSSPGALARDTLSRGKSHLQLLESELRRVTSELEEEERGLVSRKEDLLREQAKQEQTCKIREEEKRETEQRLLRVQQEQGSSRDLEDIQESIDIASEELASLRASRDTEQMESEVQQLVLSRQEREKLIPSLERENNEMEKEDFIRRAVENYKKERESKKRYISDTLSKINPDLESLFVWPPPLSELEGKLLELKNEKEEERRNASSKLEAMNKELSDATARKKLCEQQATQCQDNLDKFNSRKRELCGDQEYTQVMEELKQEYQAEQDKLVTVSSSKQFYKECQSFIELRHACPVCKRAFDKPEGMKPVLESLEKRIKHVAPNMMSQQQSQLSELRRKLENLQKLSGSSEDMVTVEKSTLPSLLAEHDQLVIQENELAQEINMQEKQVKTLQTILEKINTLVPDVRVLSEKENECKEIDSKISAESKKLKTPIPLKSIEEVRSQLRKTQREIKLFESQITEKQTSKLKHENEVRAKEQQIHELKSAQLEQQKRKQKQTALLEKKIELEKNLESLDKSIREVRQSLTPIKSRILKFESELKEKRMENEKTLTGKRKKIELFKSLIAKISEKQKEIDSVSSDINQTDYDTCIREITQARSRTENLNVRLQELRTNISKIENEIANSRNINREYTDAIELIGHQATLRELKEEIAELASELERNPLKKLHTTMSQIESVLRTKRSKRDKLTGELEEKKKQADKIRRTLNSDQCLNIIREHDIKRFEHMTVGYLIKDLEYAYHKLDRCMMQFHKSKIEQINAILQELWQKIYKGSDIDYIQITADDEGTSSVGGRCSYNYRVVMIKGDIEMGMRGRCSAGQKVLACILIRLALAETFCGRCGVIALDEPTTNLDQRNVASLAENLIDLLEVKAQTKSNFQMILITHDQKFVEKFEHAEFVEHYWQLSKTDNFSQIKKLAFSHNSY